MRIAKVRWRRDAALQHVAFPGAIEITPKYTSGTMDLSEKGLGFVYGISEVYIWSAAESPKPRPEEAKLLLLKTTLQVSARPDGPGIYRPVIAVDNTSPDQIQ